MKKLFGLMTLALVLTAAQSAFANSTLHTLVTCKDQLAASDYGVEVSVQQYSGPTGLGQITADVSEETFAGPRQFGSFVVTKKAVPPKMLGAPLTYVGKDFELTLCTDCAPQPQGITGHLTAEANGRKIVEALYCKLGE
jgi:hypothetical protein